MGHKNDELQSQALPRSPSDPSFPPSPSCRSGFRFDWLLFPISSLHCPPYIQSKDEFTSSLRPLKLVHVIVPPSLVGLH